MKKMLLILITVIGSLTCDANSEIEQNIYSTLKISGAYVNYSNTTAVRKIGVIKINSLNCFSDFRGLNIQCSYVENARPFEKTKISGNEANAIYKSLKLSGVKVGRLRGESFLSVEELMCRRSNIIGDSESTVNCFRLRPLILL